MKKLRFLVELNHQQGEYESHHCFLLTATVPAKARAAAEEFARTWYGDDADSEDEGDHYFGCGEVCITLAQVEQISETAYQELLNVFHDLTSKS